MEFPVNLSSNPLRGDCRCVGMYVTFEWTYMPELFIYGSRCSHTTLLYLSVSALQIAVLPPDDSPPTDFAISVYPKRPRRTGGVSKRYLKSCYKDIRSQFLQTRKLYFICNTENCTPPPLSRKYSPARYRIALPIKIAF